MEFEDLFTLLEPPRGGLERLRARLDKEKRKSVFLRAMKPASRAYYAGAAIVVVFLTILLIFQVVLPSLSTSEGDLFSLLVAQSDDPSLIRYGFVKAPEETVTVPEREQTQLAVLKVPVRSEEVIFYWVSSLPLNESFENGTRKSGTD